MPHGQIEILGAREPILSEIVAKRSRSSFIGYFANHQET
jgi:hypothetical protein